MRSVMRHRTGGEHYRGSHAQAGSGCLAPGALLPTSMPSMLRSSSISGQCTPKGDSS